MSKKVEASQECICCECGNKCGILKDGTFHCEHCLPKKQKVEDSQKTNLNDEAKIILDEIERGIYERPIDVFDAMFLLLDEALRGPVK